VVGRALAPVEAIREEVEAISSSELHRRVPDPPGDDEIARLAATMHRMLARLEAEEARPRRFVSDAAHELAAHTPVGSATARRGRHALNARDRLAHQRGRRWVSAILAMREGVSAVAGRVRDRLLEAADRGPCADHLMQVLAGVRRVRRTERGKDRRGHVARSRWSP
jgi:hypothetical protein